MIAPHYADGPVTIYAGDCIHVMRQLPNASVHAVVTDPPYALDFMGHGWDRYTPGQFQHWCEEWATEALRVLKPGGHLLAFGGTRTFHRLTAGIEDAGFEIRDSIAWMYGSGFPKSLNLPGGLGTALKPAFEPIVVARKPLTGTVASNVLTHGVGALNIDANRIISGPTANMDAWEPDASLCSSCAADAESKLRPGTPVTKASIATRPAELMLNEPQRPNRRGMSKTATGCSDGTSETAAIGTNSSTATSGSATTASSRQGSSSITETTTPSTTGSRTCNSCLAPITTATVTSASPSAAGRWPSNVILDESQAAALDQQSGIQRDGVAVNRNTDPDARKPSTVYGAYLNGSREDQGYGGIGGASRFFKVVNNLEQLDARFRYEAKAPGTERPEVDGTSHATVKPVDLMRWLVRLVTPTGGTVLEPFAGSGATVEACVLEGFDCIAIEREPSYLPLIEKRIRKPHHVGFDFGDWDGAA